MDTITVTKHTRVAKGSNNIFLNSLGIFLLLTTFLFLIDFVPDLQKDNQNSKDHNDEQLFVKDTSTEDKETAISLSSNESVNATAVTTINKGSIPVRISIKKIGLDTSILAPESTDIEVLDRALLHGAVHYPGSGLLGENANMLLFGHSSYLPVVHNQAFKAFNELSKLKNGDEIIVFSKKQKYVYIVNKVWLAEAGDTEVHFDSTEPTLTLATCNTFGAKQDRWVVTANLESKETIN